MKEIHKNESLFVDILEERRLQSDIKWASRPWNAASSYKLPKRYSPQEIKSVVFGSYRLSKILKKISVERDVPVSRLFDIVDNILNEIGYERKVPILRWLGYFVSKILKKVLSSLYVNETKILEIRSQMGNNPLIFIPSHKSYCDFILMSFICFNYEIDIPRIAAGMDFQSMTVMGNILRDACAFFMRRTFNDDELYSAVFSQYVQTLVLYGDGPIEFFIEGTRSRTQKSLMPKFGFLSMSLKPFLTGLVPDITIVPVNLSYDRVLEEVLFAYELLGVPKPKETTMGFIKALNNLNQNYGNAFVQFGDPISVKKYFGNKIDRSVHGFGSVEMQDLTQEEVSCLINLAHSIIRRHKELASITCFNLIAAVLNNYLQKQTELPDLNDLTLEVQWLFEIVKVLAPKTSTIFLKSITQDEVLHHIKIHNSLVHLSADNKIQLFRISTESTMSNTKQLKGHELSKNIMDIAIPILMLQLYVNPCANFLVSICFIALIIESSNRSYITIEELYKNFEFLCSIFSFEFVSHSDFVQEDFNEALNHSKHFRIIHLVNENQIERGDNDKFHSFCINYLNSFMPGYITTIEVLIESTGEVLSEKQILKVCQQRLESKLSNGLFIHPANLSLDLLSNAVQALVSMKAVFKGKGKNGSEYRSNEEELKKIYTKLKAFDFSQKIKMNVLDHFSVFLRARL